MLVHILPVRVGIVESNIADQIRRKSVPGRQCSSSSTHYGISYAQVDRIDLRARFVIGCSARMAKPKEVANFVENSCFEVRALPARCGDLKVEEEGDDAEGY